MTCASKFNHSIPRTDSILSQHVSGTVSWVPRSHIRVVVDAPKASSTVLLRGLGGTKQPDDSWHFPPFLMYVYQLMRLFDLTLDDSAYDVMNSAWGFGVQPTSVPPELVDNFNRLFDFQKDAIEFLLSSPHHGSLLSLSPGLGKSAVSILAAEMLRAKRVLICAPLSLLRTWETEIRKWGSKSTPISIVRGSAPLPSGQSYWAITNYDTLVRRSEKFLKPWDCVIFDESVLIKNRNAQRSMAAFSIAQQAKKVWLLSGSPITREVDDLWSQFHTIQASAFRSYWRFAEAYCIIETPPWGKGVVGSKLNINFQEEFRDLLFVRHQKDVLDLPEIQEETILLDLLPAQQKLYDQALHDFIIELSSGDSILLPSRVAQMTRLMEITSHPGNVDSSFPLLSDGVKQKAILDLLESSYFHLPAILWVHWRPGAIALYEGLRSKGYNVALVSGDTPDRDLIIEQYRRGSIDLLILSISVGKYGLTLTNTRTMIYVDRTFDMDAFIQSLHRVQRIGLTFSPSSIILHCPNTIDTLVAENLRGKAFSISQISNADLVQLIKQIGGLS